jgi:YfiH family protein
LFLHDDNGVYRAEPLAALKWVEHGFGSKSAGAWAPRDRLLTLRQIHSDIIVRGSAPGHRERDGDGLISEKAGLLVGVRTADCQPLLIADPRRGAVGAVHAGWRGAAARIAAGAIEAMARAFGTDPADVIVAIGPSIRRCCYEVGPEVAAAFGIRAEGKSHIDLPEITAQQLRSAGVPVSSIFIAPACTCCDAAFHSWRRDRDEGRMLSAIGVR